MNKSSTDELAENLINDLYGIYHEGVYFFDLFIYFPSGVQRLT